jgi:hypothetical protein
MALISCVVAAGKGSTFFSKACQRRPGLVRERVRGKSCGCDATSGSSGTQIHTRVRTLPSVPDVDDINSSARAHASRSHQPCTGLALLNTSPKVLADLVIYTSKLHASTLTGPYSLAVLACVGGPQARSGVWQALTLGPFHSYTLELVTLRMHSLGRTLRFRVAHPTHRAHSLASCRHHAQAAPPTPRPPRRP